LPADVSPGSNDIDVMSTVALQEVEAARFGMTTASATLSPLPAPAVQRGALVEVPAVLSYVPEGHVPHAVQDV
jgi:hypothetical protein